MGHRLVGSIRAGNSLLTQLGSKIIKLLIEGVAAQNNCFVNLFVFVYFFSVKFIILLLDGQVGLEPTLI